MVARNLNAHQQKSPRILVGTASWSDPEFAIWYPPRMPAKERLGYYSEHLNLVEINTSYYAIPRTDVVASWAKQTPEGFTFDVKLFQLLSRHRTTLDRLPRDLRRLAAGRDSKVRLTPVLERELAKRIIEAITPLREAGKLGALLLQLTPSFGPHTHRLEELDAIVGYFHGYKFAVELRHRSWVEGDQLDRTIEYFQSRRLAYVAVDAPFTKHFMAMPPLDIVTTAGLAYLRAHGRNALGYLHGRTVSARFDYDYSEEELQEIAARVSQLAAAAMEVHVVYNNNKSDYALRAAERTREIIEDRKPEGLVKKSESRLPSSARHQ